MTAPGGVDFGKRDVALRLAQTILLERLRGADLVGSHGPMPGPLFTIGVHLGVLIGLSANGQDWRDWFAEWSPPGPTVAAMITALLSADEPS